MKRTLPDSPKQPPEGSNPNDLDRRPLMSTYSAIDPKTGARLREATPDEKEMFFQKTNKMLDAVRVGEVLIEKDGDPRPHTGSAWDWI